VKTLIPFATEMLVVRNIRAVDAEHADDTFQLLSRLLAQLYMRLGERRIDVPASVRGRPDTRAVVQAARGHGIELVRT
jgi:hypothetical protein